MSSKSSIKFDPSLVDEDEGHVIVITSAVMTGLIILSTSCRISMKLYHRMRLQAEDYFIVLGLALNLSGNSVEFEAVTDGFGRHLQFLSNEQESRVRMWNQLGILFANLAIWAVKLSICLLILSLIRGAHYRSRWTIYGLMCITSIAHGCQTLVWAIQARPLAKLWNPKIPGKIASRRTLVNSIIAFTAISSVTDLFYALSPLYFFGRLQMSASRKITIIALTGSGLLVFAASITRVAFVNDFFKPDVSWALRRVYLATIIERNVAQVIADLPVVFPLLRNMHRKARSLFSSSANKSRATYHNSGTSTIGSKHKRFNRSTGNSEFSRYGRQAQISAVRPGSDDEIPLRERPGVVNPSPLADGEIAVQVNIDVHSEDGSNRVDGPAKHWLPE